MSWDKVLGCVVCRFHVPAGAKLRPGQVFWRHCPELLQSYRASIFGSLVLSPTGSINLGFTTEGRLADVLIITFSWGFQLSSYIYTYNSYINTTPPTSFLAPLPGRKKISARGVSRFQPFTLLLFCFIFAWFYKKYKKIVPLIVGIPLLLLLVHYVVP
jgi:hypothetical protein